MTPLERAERVKRLAPAMVLAVMRRDETTAHDTQIILEEMLGRTMGDLDALPVSEAGQVLQDFALVLSAFSQSCGHMVQAVAEATGFDPVQLIEGYAAALAKDIPTDD